MGHDDPRAGAPLEVEAQEGKLGLAHEVLLHEPLGEGGAKFFPLPHAVVRLLS